MHLRKLISLTFRFYAGWYFFSTVITAFCLYMVYKSGMILSGFFIWAKVLGYLLTLYWNHQFKSTKLYYYYNQHILPRFLWIVTIMLDFLIFLFLSLLINYWR